MKYILIFLLLIACGCNKKKTVAANQYQPFFYFDKVEYYHTNIDAKALMAIKMKQDKTRKEQALLQILAGDVPVSIKDTLFIKNMEILGFEKETLDQGLNSKLSNLFSFREVSKPITAKCKSDYKDILIFRRDGRIIGMAKISFDCLKHQMIGERYNDSQFGQSGEYQELEKILHH